MKRKGNGFDFAATKKPVHEIATRSLWPKGVADGFRDHMIKTHTRNLKSSGKRGKGF